MDTITSSFSFLVKYDFQMTFNYIKNGNYNGISPEIVESYGICGIEGASSTITKVVATIFIMLIK